MGIVSSFCPGCQRTVYVGASDTLTCPVCASPLVAAKAEDPERVSRIAKNETLFREMNERIEETVKGSEAPASDPTDYVCECGDKECTETLKILPADYEAIRKHPAQFMVLSGHVVPEAERVLDDRGAYLIVEKVGPGRVIASETDPRSESA
ncbi:MAG: hypothetical protein QOH26_722 [Actinomycetota bacterium]|jgi:hypothetical protein|nr:hypothetical protein [Actinomycetota bacterium]